MERSEQINDLIGALAKAQGAFGATVKDRENPHFKSSYATLASGWNAARAALSANGLAVVQSLQTEENGIEVETMLAHMSGQWLTSKLFVPTAKFDAQGLGSASTYGRRYAVFAILGLAPEDDDGNDAAESMKGRNDRPVERTPPPREQPKPKADDVPRFSTQGKWVHAKEWNGKPLADAPLDVLEVYREVVLSAAATPARDKVVARVELAIEQARAEAALSGAPQGNGWVDGDRITDKSPEA